MSLAIQFTSCWLNVPERHDMDLLPALYGPRLAPVHRIHWNGHYMMTSSNGNISALLAFCAGNSPVTVNSPHKGQWRGALMFSFICAWINDWVNNCEAGDLRCHRAHYDATIDCILTSFLVDNEGSPRVKTHNFIDNTSIFNIQTSHHSRKITKQMIYQFQKYLAI